MTQTWSKLFLNIASSALPSHFSALSLLSLLVLCGFTPAVLECGLLLWGALTQNTGYASSQVDLSISGPWAEVLIHLFPRLWMSSDSHLSRFNVNKEATFWQSIWPAHLHSLLGLGFFWYFGVRVSEIQREKKGGWKGKKRRLTKLKTPNQRNLDAFSGMFWIWILFILGCFPWEALYDQGNQGWHRLSSECLFPVSSL